VFFGAPLLAEFDPATPPLFAEKWAGAAGYSIAATLYAAVVLGPPHYTEQNSFRGVF